MAFFLLEIFVLKGIKWWSLGGGGEGHWQLISNDVAIKYRVFNIHWRLKFEEFCIKHRGFINAGNLILKKIPCNVTCVTLIENSLE